jgi:DNA-binding transcriptional LysR family regulator
MMSADRLHEFTAIVDAGSISGASRVLEIPRATLSRRMSALEAELGVRLIHRETRRLVLTPAGEELYSRAQRVVADTEAAWASVRACDDVPRGPLRVSVADSRIAQADLFVEFARDHPEVRLEVSVTPRHVDLVAEGIDVAVRIGTVNGESLVARRLWSTRSFPVASPEYLERRGTPRRPNELAKHDCIVGFAGEQTPQRTWPRLDGGSVPVGVRFASSGIDLRIAAAERGLGIALLPQLPIAEQLRDGRLVPVLDGVVGLEIPMSLVFAEREFMPPRMRLFIDRAIEFFRDWGP